MSSLALCTKDNKSIIMSLKGNMGAIVMLININKN